MIDHKNEILETTLPNVEMSILHLLLKGAEVECPFCESGVVAYVRGQVLSNMTIEVAFDNIIKEFPLEYIIQHPKFIKFTDTSLYSVINTFTCCA